MKKLTRMLCLTLAMLMLMSTGAFAVTVQDPAQIKGPVNGVYVNEDFAGVYASSSLQAHQFDTKYNTSSADSFSIFKESSSSGTAFTKVYGSTQFGLAGKGIGDQALHTRITTGYTKSAYYNATVYTGPVSSCTVTRTSTEWIDEVAGTFNIIVETGTAKYKNGSFEIDETTMEVTSTTEAVEGDAFMDAPTIAYSNYVNHATNDPITLEFDFLRLGELGTNITLYYYDENNSSNSRALVSGTKLGGSYKTEEGETVPACEFKKNEWTHVAFEIAPQGHGRGHDDINGGDVIAYVNGEKIGIIEESGYSKSVISQLTLRIYALTYNASNVDASGTAYPVSEYAYAIDNIKISNGLHGRTYTPAGLSLDANVENGVLTVPYGTTVADLVGISNGCTLRAYADETTMLTLKNATSATGAASLTSNELAANALLSDGNILVAENATKNGYAYYEIKIEEGLFAKQAGEIKENSFASLTDDIVINYADTAEAAGTRIMLVGVYNESGKLVKAYLSDETATDFTAGAQGTLNVTVPAADLTGLTNGAKVKAFIWTDTDDVQPIETQFIDLLYTAE
ncbi:MAG: hypothetical protein E7403_06285 [Ruminococcaceae bacterium]|nr:hypothetical protein [Oscillospiraceae bacterium]